MSCNFCEEKIEAYVLGLLNIQDQAQVAEHIQSCANCQQAMELHQKTTRLLDQAFQEKPAEWLSQKTIAKMRDRQVRPLNWLKWGVPVLAGAAAVLLLVVIQPGRIAKQGMEQSLGKTSKTAMMDAEMAPSAAIHIITEELDIHLNNPIQDRSIYEDLGVATEVAKLLL